MPIRIAIVGLGKIARDQHIPVIAASSQFELAATASRNNRLDGVASFRTIEDLIASDVAFDAVALCQPPQGRYEAARAAIAAGKHVFLEKPPGATLSEVRALEGQAKEKGVTLFASWHSRCAPGVEAARQWIAAQGRVVSARIEWKEDVRYWHPGQQWIWEPGGLGVFDPGVNALSIATEILPNPFFLTRAALDFPSNRAAPIAAELSFADAEGAPIEAVFDFRQTGPQTWDITVETDGGPLKLSKGGSELFINGARQETAAEAEYSGLYTRFAELIVSQRSDVDLAPLQHVADAFLRGERRIAEAFED